jgi:transposase InsO family protein
MTVDELKRVDLVELLTRARGMSFRPQGGCFVAPSPFRAEAVPSFYASRAEDGHWVWHDHGEGMGGSVIDFMMRESGHADFRRALEAAESLAAGSGLAAPAAAPGPGAEPEERDWGWLHERLRSNDATPCRGYLTGRGLDSALVDRMAADGSVVLNRLDGSDYCCFAIRSPGGGGLSLFNRRIGAGGGGPEKFLLGRRRAFCLDWGALAAAAEIHVCESVIDALSVLSLRPGSHVVAALGAGHDLSAELARLPDALVVDAFDDDPAGRAAGERLRAALPGRRFERFGLEGFKDVNELLLGAGRRGPKLSVADRVAIAMSSEPSRVLAERHGVHHSRVCDIRKAAADILAKELEVRRPGPRPAPAPAVEVEELRGKVEELERERSLLMISNDWLNLQLRFASEDLDDLRKSERAAGDKKKKPERNTMTLKLIDKHAAEHPLIPSAERLRRLGLPPNGRARLERAVVERAARESAIPEGDAEAVVRLLFENPEIGAGKASLTLVNRGEALVSAVFVNDAKRLMMDMAAEEYARRVEEDKTLEAELAARTAAEDGYRHIEALRPHHIWAIDFVFVSFLGFSLRLCVVYDVFSQAYLAIAAGEACGRELAARALEEAAERAGKALSPAVEEENPPPSEEGTLAVRDAPAAAMGSNTAVGKENMAVDGDGPRAAPELYLRRDNGKAFMTEDFQKLLANLFVKDNPIPPGSPWLNGSMESNNTGLKTTAKTFAMWAAAADPGAFAGARRSPGAAVGAIQKLCGRTLDKLNRDISRAKFGMPPQDVLDGRVEAVKAGNEAFVKRKLKERVERMEALRRDGPRGGKDKTYLEKVAAAFRQVMREAATNMLYAFNEISHGRFRAVET